MDIGIGLFIISMDHMLPVYIFSIKIHWELIVEFSYDFHEIFYF